VSNPLLSPGFASIRSLFERTLAGSPRRPQLLSWASAPYSTSGREGPQLRALPARCVPSSGFGYPLDGFRPSLPCRLCFAPAALVGFTLRSFLRLQGNAASPLRWTHMPFACRSTRSPKRGSRAAVPRLLGFDPCERPLRERWRISSRCAGCSLGFLLFQGVERKPWAGFRPLSSHALSAVRSVFASRGTSEYPQPSLGSARTASRP